MHSKLSKLREKRARGESGFTLIELLVVVVIIGILIAIAIPLYLNYRKGANDKAAQSDLRGAVSTLEQCNSDNSVYPSGPVGLTGAFTGTPVCAQVVKMSTGTTMAYYPVSTTDFTGYIVESKNSSGSGIIYCYSSAAGGSVGRTAATAFVTAYAATCPA